MYKIYVYSVRFAIIAYFVCCVKMCIIHLEVSENGCTHKSCKINMYNYVYIDPFSIETHYYYFYLGYRHLSKPPFVCLHMVKSVLHSWNQIKWAGWAFGSASQFVEWIITISILCVISQVYVGYTTHPKYYVGVVPNSSSVDDVQERLAPAPCALLRGLGFRAHVFIGQ